jgi:hypothetical protein
MTSEQIDDRLDDLITKPKDEWTVEDYQALLEAYQRADQETRDQVWAILRGSEVPR